MMLIWMLRPEASGVGARTHILILGFFTPMFPATAPLAFLLSIEDAKKQEYGHQVRDIEHGVFTPLVFTSTGGMGHEATVFYRHLADLLATHWGQEYCQTINWLRCRLSFALLRCAILCICGRRSSAHHPALRPQDLSVVLAESRLAI